NKTDQSVLLQDEIDLPFPEVNREISQIVEKRIILRGSDWQFQYFVYKVGHNRATPAALWLQVPRVGNRHVIGEIKIRVPLLPAVQDSGPKGGRPKAPSVFVDFFRTLPKL